MMNDIRWILGKQRARMEEQMEARFQQMEERMEASFQRSEQRMDEGFQRLAQAAAGSSIAVSVYKAPEWPFS